MDTSLNGKRAVVTAGAGGAGLVIAQTLLTEGAEVFVCDIDEKALSNLPNTLHGTHVDVSNADGVTQWLQPIVEDGIDILINNAGIAGPTVPLEDIALDDWDQCLATDLNSVFYCTRLVVPHMKRKKQGAIINLSSTAGLMGLPNRSPYTAAKFAIVGLTKTWAMELGRDNIRVNAIAPGSISGDRMERVMAAHAAAEKIDQDQVRSMYTAGVSMATFVEPQEIADMILFLVSERGRHISGQIIGVDGHTETLHPRSFSHRAAI